MATITPISKPLTENVQENRAGGKLRYGQALPHELEALAPLIVDFCKEVKYEQAVTNPRPFIAQIYREMSTNPYSIFYVCVNENMQPQGYTWFKVEQNVWGESFVTIEHDYLLPEHRDSLRGARIHRQFINYIIEIGERCHTKRVSTHVKTKSLEASRMKLGFKPVELKMTFEGSAADFRNQNPSFMKVGKYEEQEVEEDGWRRRTDKTSTGE